MTSRVELDKVQVSERRVQKQERQVFEWPLRNAVSN